MCRTLICTLVVLVVGYSPAAGVDTWEEIIPGVQHLHRVTSTPWQIHVIKADLTNPRVRVCVMIKNDNDYPDAGEQTSLMARRHRAVAAINTDFFCGGGCANVWHCPQGYTVTDGLYQLPPGFGSPINPSRTTFQISKLQDQVLVDTVSVPPELVAQRNRRRPAACEERCGQRRVGARRSGPDEPPAEDWMRHIRRRAIPDPGYC